MATTALQCASTSKQPAPHGPLDAEAPDGGGDGFCGSCTLVPDGPKVALPSESELSGVAASAVHPGVYYVHNDSGDEPRFFAIDESGALKGTFRVKGAVATDWEDVDVGPCAGPGSPSCIFLADAGDNNAKRNDYVLYRVPEPKSVDGATVDVTAEAIPFRYPDGSHDSETILVHPESGRIVLVTKAKAGPSAAYTFPADLKAGVSVTLTRAAEVVIPDANERITSGSVHPQGKGVLLRTYNRAFYFAGTPGQPIEEMLRSSPCRVPAATEAQGEAIAWMRSGAGWVTLSEGAATLHAVRCGG